MASEREYTRGQRLRALVISFQMGTGYMAALEQMEPADEHVDDALAETLQKNLCEEIWAERRKVQLPPLSHPRDPQDSISSRRPPDPTAPAEDDD